MEPAESNLGHPLGVGSETNKTISKLEFSFKFENGFGSNIVLTQKGLVCSSSCSRLGNVANKVWPPVLHKKAKQYLTTIICLFMKKLITTGQPITLLDAQIDLFSPSFYGKTD